MVTSVNLLMEAGSTNHFKLSDKPSIRGGLVDYHLMVKVKMHMDHLLRDCRS